MVVAVLLFTSTWGCVRRTLTITTDPPNALVYLNDQEIGRSEVSRDFLWYGDYDVLVRQDGYQTLKSNWKIAPPWYQYIPLDFFAEVFWPGTLHDVHRKHFVLTPMEIPSPEDLASRAVEVRSRAIERVENQPMGSKTK